MATIETIVQESAIPKALDPLSLSTLERSSMASQHDTSNDISQENEEEGFQTILRRKNKGKQQTVCSLPNTYNIRQPYKAGLSKFAPIRNVPRNKGSGGAPHSSSSIDK